MSITEIRELPLNEKIQMMEALREELRAHAQEGSVPEWQKELLDARRKAVAEGREPILEWDQVKSSLGTPQT